MVSPLSDPRQEVLGSPHGPCGLPARDLHITVIGYVTQFHRLRERMDACQRIPFPPPHHFRGKGGMQAPVTPLWAIQGDRREGSARGVEHGIIGAVHRCIIPSFLEASLGSLQEFVGFFEAHTRTIARAERDDKRGTAAPAETPNHPPPCWGEVLRCAPTEPPLLVSIVLIYPGLTENLVVSLNCRDEVLPRNTTQYELHKGRKSPDCL